VVRVSLGKQFSRPNLEKTHHKKRAGGVAKSVGPEFKSKYCKKKKKKEKKEVKTCGHTAFGC
jgi:hypothetical protein